MLHGLYFLQQSSQTEILASEQFMAEESGTYDQNGLRKKMPVFKHKSGTYCAQM